MTSRGRKDDSLGRLSLLVLTFNQEQYIADALTSALSQSVPSLEVVISDDCSKDCTFHLIQEIVNRYSGDFDVKVNRNPKNLGIVGNLYAGLELVSNDWVVLGAGDDVYHLDRCKEIFNVITSIRRIKAVYSATRLIDKNNLLMPGSSAKVGKYPRRVRLLDIASNGGGVGTGATYCYHKSVFYEPWRVPEGIRSEDRILPLRAFFTGGVQFVPIELVDYRVNHGCNVGQQLVEQGRLAIQDASHRQEVDRTLRWALDRKLVSRLEYFAYKLVANLSCRVAVLVSARSASEDNGRLGIGRLKLAIMRRIRNWLIFLGKSIIR